MEEMRQRLEEKNRLIEKKTQQAVQAQQERNRSNNELTELKDHMDIKDRKINVLQRKVSVFYIYDTTFLSNNEKSKFIFFFRFLLYCSLLLSFVLVLSLFYLFYLSRFLIIFYSISRFFFDSFLFL